MRDPALPPPKRASTQWSGGARKVELDSFGRGEEGLVRVRKRMFPLQGWAFVLGFVIFPMWWVAALAPVSWGWGLRKEVQDGKGVDPEMAWTEQEKEVRRVMEYDGGFFPFLFLRTCVDRCFFSCINVAKTVSHDEPCGLVGLFADYYSIGSIRSQGVVCSLPVFTIIPYISKI